MVDPKFLEIKILGHERTVDEGINSTIDNFVKLEKIFGSIKEKLTNQIQIRRDRIETIQRRIETVITKIQQVDKINKPLVFQSPGKYPEIKRPDKLIHTHTTRHAVVFAPVEKTKEFIHAQEQLSNIVCSTDNDLKDLLEITKACFNREWFSKITSNPDLVKGVGETPQCATSLSDFIMYGGSRNPYLEDIKDLSQKKSKQDEKTEKEKVVQQSVVAPSILTKPQTTDAPTLTLKINKPPPKIIATKPSQLDDAFDIGDDPGDPDENLAIVTNAKSGLDYLDGMGDDQDQPAAEDQKLHGDALDLISEKKPGFGKKSQVSQASPTSKPSVSQSIAMPRMSYDTAQSTYISPPAQSAYIAPPAQDNIAPPPIDNIPVPPPISDSIPVPPPIDDIPVPPPIDEVPVPPPVSDIPAPPAIAVPVRAPAAPSQPKATSATGERSKFLDSIASMRNNPLAKLKAVPKDQINDGSLTLTEKQAQRKKQAKQGMAKAQNSLLAAVQERFKQMHSKPAKKNDSDDESD